MLLVFVAPVFLALGVRYVPDREMPITGESVKVFEGNKLEFNIENPKENLVGVGVVVRNPGRSGADLKLFLYDENNNLVRESSLNGLSIPDGALVKFIFLPITYKSQILRGIFSSDADIMGAMEICLEKDTDIPAYISFYKPVSKWVLILDIYGRWVKKLLFDTPFVLVYLLVVIGLTLQISTSLFSEYFSRFSR